MITTQLGGAPIDQPTVHRALASDARVRLLDELRASTTPLDAAELADRAGLHVNTVRGHLTVLEEAALVTRETEKRGRPGRPRVLYAPAPETGADATNGYRFLAEMLATGLATVSGDPAGTAQQIGEVWGRHLAQRRDPFTAATTTEAIAQLVDLFAARGFAPEAETDPDGRTDLRLLRCPFLQLARQHGDIVCSLHHGLIRGMLDELGAPLEAGDLRPFVAPNLCIAELTAA